jgi:hypothetical protein
MCDRHRKLFTLENIKQCDLISGFEDISNFTNWLKNQNLFELRRYGRYAATNQFALMTIKLQILAIQIEMCLF